MEILEPRNVDRIMQVWCTVSTAHPQPWVPAWMVKMCQINQVQLEKQKINTFPHLLFPVSALPPPAPPHLLPPPANIPGSSQ